MLQLGTPRRAKTATEDSGIFKITPLHRGEERILMEVPRELADHPYGVPAPSVPGHGEIPRAGPCSTEPGRLARK